MFELHRDRVAGRCVGLRTWLVLGALAAVAVAAEPQRTHLVEPEDYFTLDNISSVATSPNGMHVAYTVARWDKDADKRLTDIWLVPTAGGTPHRLTFDGAGYGGLQWGPDMKEGAYLYVAGGRKQDKNEPPFNGKRQVWRINIATGEMQPMTREKRGIDDFVLSRDGKTIYYTQSHEFNDPAWKDLQSKFDELEYGRGVYDVSTLSKISLETWRSEQLVDANRFIRYFAVSPDERRIAMITDPRPDLITHEGRSQVDVLDTQSGKIATVPSRLFREEAPSPHGWLGDLAWNDAGDRLAFTVGFDGYQTELFAAQWGDNETPGVWKINRVGELTVTGMAHWKPGTNDLCFVGEDHARARVYCVRNVAAGKQGETEALTPGDIVAMDYSFSQRGGQLVANIATLTNPGDLYVVEGKGGMPFRQLTDINPQVATWKLPQISLVKWTGADGDSVEGILELPPDYKEGDGPLPLVVELHGGPTAATLYRLRFWIYGRTLFPSMGYALLSPNYHGSTGYGDRFMTKLIGRENEIEVTDIMSGVDALIERGIADPQRLGVMGWSNGGFLTNAVITSTDRFKAASSGAGVSDMLIQWAVEDTPGHVINYMQGLPWEQPEAYHKGSPIWKLNNVVTATLIHCGKEDERVPLPNSLAMFRGLYEYLGVPCMLVVYPGAGHGLVTYKHRRAKMEWDVAWFERYVRGEGSKPAPSKDDAAAAAAHSVPDAASATP